MTNYHISVNQFAAFSKATAKAKKRIISNQIKVDLVLVSWYQTARASIRKYFHNFNDISPLKECIDKLRAKKAETKHAKIDQRVSIEAIENIMLVAFPNILYGKSYEFITPEKKPVNVDDVNISISPEAIFKIIVNGKASYGGIKLHFGKSKPFDYTQCRYISILLQNYIKDNIVKHNEKVDPKLCLCIDIFSQRVVNGDGQSSSEIKRIKNICEEIKAIWATAV